MNLEQYFRKKEIEKLAKEVAKKSVAEIMGKVSMFKVGEAVVLKNSSQNKVMRIQAYNDEFIRAYYGDKDYSFAHESNFRHATPEEIASGHRIDHISQEGNMVHDLGNDSHIENHISPLCKVGVK